MYCHANVCSHLIFCYKQHLVLLQAGLTCINLYIVSQLAIKAEFSYNNINCIMHLVDHHFDSIKQLAISSFVVQPYTQQLANHSSTIVIVIDTPMHRMANIQHPYTPQIQNIDVFIHYVTHASLSADQAGPMAICLRFYLKLGIVIAHYGVSSNNSNNQQRPTACQLQTNMKIATKI